MASIAARNRVAIRRGSKRRSFLEETGADKVETVGVRGELQPVSPRTPSAAARRTVSPVRSTPASSAASSRSGVRRQPKPESRGALGVDDVRSFLHGRAASPIASPPRDETTPPSAGNPTTGTNGGAPRRRDCGAPRGGRRRVRTRKPAPEQQPVTNDTSTYTGKEALFFSHKPRPVEYRPKTLREYKELQPTEYVELGTLGADLESEEVKEKQAARARMLAFAEQAHAANRVVHRAAPRRKPAPQEEQARRDAEQAAAEASARERMQAFAARVPKPKTKASKRPPRQEKRRAEGTSQQQVHNAAGVRRDSLAELEAQHDRLRQEAARIRSKTAGAKR